MKRKLKRTMAASIAGMMAFSLAACGSSGGTESTGESDAAEAPAEKYSDSTSIKTLAEALNPDEEVELDLWCIANESDSYHNAYVTALEDFEKTYPKVKVNIEYYENESYKTKLKSAMAADEIPDIVYSWQGGFSQSFAEAGKLLSLTPYYEAEYTELLPESHTQNGRYVDGSLYTTSFSVNCSLLMYNKKIFSQYGLTAPTTWDEFMEVCQKLADNGVAPIATSAKDVWCLAVLHDALGLKSAGHDKTVAALTRSGGSYDDDDFLFAAQQIQKLTEMGAFVEGAAGLSYNEQLELFRTGGAAMMPQLANACMDVYNAADNPDDFDVVRIPVVGDNAAVTDMVGGASESFLVSAETEYPDQAAYAAFELSRRIAAVAQEDGVTTSPWTDTPATEGLSEFQQKIEDYKAQATSYCLWWDTTMIADDAAEYLSLLEQLYTGDITAEDFVAGMDAQLSN